MPEVVRIDRVSPYHIVKEGESIGNIADAYAMTRAELIKLNNLAPPYQLYNGQRLVIKVKISDTSSVVPDPDIVSKEKTNDKVATVKEEEVVPPTEEKQQQYIAVPENEESAVENDETTEITEYIWPINDGKSKISKKFSDSDDGEIVMQVSAGTVIRAIAEGVIKLAKPLDGEASSYGNTVIILHGGKNKLSVYSHLKEFSVKEGDRVKKGGVIGKVGKTGNAKTPQLCLQIYEINRKDKSRKAINPEDVLP
jgi:murein DD-endopeptidase MepM/ murein hydrolase activator NlpD